MADNKTHDTMEWRADLTPFQGINVDDIDFGRGNGTVPANWGIPEAQEGEGNGFETLPDKATGPMQEAEPLTEGFMFTDDGRIVPVVKLFHDEFVPIGDIPTPGDFRDWLQATNDWGMSHPGESRPDIFDWKKSQPGYEENAEGMTMELPEELRVALEEAAQESGQEPPFSIIVTEESCPELYDKLMELYQEANPAAFDHYKEKDQGMRSLTPEELPDEIREKFEKEIPGFGEKHYDPSPVTLEPPNLDGMHLTPEQLEEIAAKAAEGRSADVSDKIGSKFVPDLNRVGLTQAQLEEIAANAAEGRSADSDGIHEVPEDSDFYDIFNDKLKDIDLDKAFEGIEAPTLGGAVVENPLYTMEEKITDAPKPGHEAVMLDAHHETAIDSPEASGDEMEMC